MSEFQRPGSTYVVNEDKAAINAYLTRVFTIMGIGLGVTAVIAFALFAWLSTGGIALLGSWGFMGTILLVVAQLGITIALSRGITKYSTQTCTILFYVYCALTGITFSILPFAYDVGTLFTAFAFAAVLFISCAVIGHTTKVDLTRFQGLLLGGLLALILMSVLSLFIPAFQGMNLIIGYIGLILFLILTAFDIQKIKQYYYGVGEGEIKDNLAIFGAFQLYLDFINIFLYILRILGNRRD